MSREIGGAEEGGPYPLILQHVKDALDTISGDFHPLPYRVVIHPMLAGQIKFFRVKTEKNHVPNSLFLYVSEKRQKTMRFC